MSKRCLKDIITKIKAGSPITNREARCVLGEMERLLQLAKQLEEDLELVCEERIFLSEFY